MWRRFKRMFVSSVDSNQNAVKPLRARTVLRMEELTSRDLPSANLLGSSLRSMFELQGSIPAIHSTAFTVHHSSSKSNSSSSEGEIEFGDDATFSATLSNATGATGTASYIANSKTLMIQVKGAAVSTTLDVQLDGTSIGSLTTDASGNGSLKLTNLTNTVNVSSALTIGDVTGTFSAAPSEYESENNEHSGREGHCGGEAAFTATISNSTGATGTASYFTNTNSLKVKVTGATASTTLDVQMDGKSIGSVSTDASGNGTVTVKSLTSAVTATSTLTVGDLTGTFTQNNFSANLSGASASVTGQAGYESLEHSLKVHFTGGTAKTTYNVLIDGTSVGILTTNQSGAGRFHLDLATLVIKSGTLLAITDSSNVTVLQGTFA